MLELKKLVKNYYVGDQTVEALKGVNLKFRKNEFVSILGPSGCGKTTMLNIIGGLDRYTSGDLQIDGISTTTYKDKDWDAYRNTTIGFVFQNYNLISHLSVVDNVEMALSLSGVSSKERREKAIKALEDVGLKDQVFKKPNQLSGGQMQRVAIARALVNDPKILLADEPTGALDSKTSKQIMKLIQEISRDRLVIMVTHNSKIAETYSDRIINLLDGEVLNDSKPANGDVKLGGNLNIVKTSMSFFAALKTSFKNLVTKKGRTIVTAIAGSIGIIGIALVLAISTGMTTYVDDLQSDTLSGYPITISENVIAEIGPGNGEGRDEVIAPSDQDEDEFPDGTTIFSNDPSETTSTHTNVFTDKFLDYLEDMDSTLYNSISYTSSISLQVVTERTSGVYQLAEVENEAVSFFGGSTSVFSEMPNNNEFVQSQYDILSGDYPTSFNEVVLVVDSENNLDVELLEALGYDVNEEYDFSDFVGKEFKVIPNDVYYSQVGDIYLPSTNYEEMYLNEDSITLTITGILRVNEEATSELLSIGVNYTTALTEYMLDNSSTSEIVTAQLANQDTNVLTGMGFNELLTYETVLRQIGGDSTPTGVQIYPVSFDTKEEIKVYLDAYNEDKTGDDIIIYTDIAEMISNTIGTLISTITIILSAFAGISLVVSSIMIGIITYVSVVERTKEIGIMRSLGARKKDISRIFTAETLLIGLTAGLLGIGIFYLLQSPVNVIIAKFIDIEGFAALPISYALGLVALSSLLTLIAGIFPSRIAAEKDPVIALRTE